MRYKRSVIDEPQLAGQEEKLEYKKRTIHFNLNSGHTRRKYIKDLETIKKQ
jgi:hypothetical protein